MVLITLDNIGRKSGRTILKMLIPSKIFVIGYFIDNVSSLGYVVLLKKTITMAIS